jgi:glutaredoxin-like protein NrdH
VTVTVHTKPACVQCDAVKRYLDRYGIEFQEVPLTPESAAAFQARGILAAPVVELPGEPPFGGYRRPLLDAWRVKTSA